MPRHRASLEARYTFSMTRCFRNVRVPLVLAFFFTALPFNTFASKSAPNLRIGTGGWPHTSGMTSPAATLPFGLVRLGPDTKWGGLLGLIKTPEGVSTAGYGAHDGLLLGFSHTRLSGTGIRTGGLFRVLPLSRPRWPSKKPVAIGFKRAREKAEPGYYASAISGERVGAELTASLHCGFHRYRLLGRKRAQREPLHLLLDASSDLDLSANSKGNARTSDDRRSLTGEVNSYGGFANRQGGVKSYFYAELSRAPSSVRGEDSPHLLLTFDPPTTSQEPEVELKLCISFVSAANARLNFDAEARGVTFDEARARAASRWSEYFSRATVESSDPKVESLFSSMLYFASLMPTHFTDVNGEYLGFDKRAHIAKGFTYRSDFSLWDTFRTAHPLYSLIAPEVQRDSLHSLLAMAEHRGTLPRWAFAAGDTGSMFGSPANFLFSESYLKGLRDFDAERALEFMEKGVYDAATREPASVKLGYCPSDQAKASVSKTLEYAWADFASAELAEAIGRTDVASLFRERAQAFRLVWDAGSRYFRPKNSNGQFVKFKPGLTSYFSFLSKSVRHYAEGSAQHWRWSVPHDPQALIELFGGSVPFVRELERFIRGASRNRSALNPGPRYWHGNEHNLHAIYLFNEAGRAELAQKWARWALRTRYGDGPNGLDGNDDGGTLSAWYVLSALGLYPQAGTDRYWLGSPAIDRARLNLGSGTTLTIVAQDQGRKNVYVQAVHVNGRRWCKPVIRHADLKNATLEFKMGPKPAQSGGYACDQSF